MSKDQNLVINPLKYTVGIACV